MKQLVNIVIKGWVSVLSGYLVYHYSGVMMINPGWEELAGIGTSCNDTEFAII